MSIRTATHRLLQNGRLLLRSFRYTENIYSSNNQPRQYLNKIHVVQIGKSQGYQPQGNTSDVSVTGRHFEFLRSHVRRIFVDNILRRVTNRLAGDLRKKVTRQLAFGNSAPFFALVGTSLASGSGLLTKDDELEGVCWEIREAISKLQWNTSENDQNYNTSIMKERSLTLKNFEIGSLIAKGCSAAVYAAKLKKIENLSDTNPTHMDNKNSNIESFPLAIKMMFNYDAESNAATILRAMYRETIPARKRNSSGRLAEWEQRFLENTPTLPPHPNIVAVYYIFTDRVPSLPDSFKAYPDALPTRINPYGSGRNMSLFLLMKRYDVTLKQYLIDRKLSIRESILLLAQLLEGITHMNAHGIAHRDLKSDNILLDLSEATDNCPSLVITDFGCCLADKNYGLHLPYNTDNIDKGGNMALMAPEIISAQPGPFTRINYSKADLWTAGTIAYEMFGLKNPFYGVSNKETVLKNYNYEEKDLPSLPNNIPSIIVALIKNMLSKNFYTRLDTEVAATIMELHLWAPNAWLKRESKMPSSNEIMEWLLCLTTKVLCEGHKSSFIFSNKFNNENNEESIRKDSYRKAVSTQSFGRRTFPEYQLIASFLGRVTLSNIRTALRWIQKNI